MKNFILILLAFLTASCAVTVPTNWTTEQEAYPGGSLGNNITTGATAFRQSVLNYTFNEVFASAEKALSFAQINVSESNQTAGILYGTRSVLVKGFTKKYYYLVKIKEEGAEKCNVSVYSKQQQSAKYIKWLPYVILPSVAMAAVGWATMSNYPANAIGFSVIWPAIFIPITAIGNSNANKSAALKWSPDDDEYLDRIMSFMRTDLLQK